MRRPGARSTGRGARLLTASLVLCMSAANAACISKKQSILPPAQAKPDASQQSGPGTPGHSAEPDALGMGSNGSDAAVLPLDAGGSPPQDMAGSPPDAGATSPPKPVVCQADELKCSRGLSCERTAWGFEDGLEGWVIPAGLNTLIVEVDASATTQRPHQGTKSLTATIEVEVLRGIFKAHRYFCGYTPATGTLEFLDLRSKNLVAWIYVAGDASDQGVTGWCRMFARGNTGQKVGEPPSDTVVMPGRWVQLRTTLPALGADRATGIELTCEFEPTPYTTVPWNGKLYLDDIAVE
jgi:hypothetical protein